VADRIHYLDCNGSTPVDPSVAEIHARTLAESYANPSATHSCGIRARRRLDAARSTVAASIGARPDEVFFTSGGSESNTWALLGSALARRRSTGGFGGHVIVSAIEHKSVLKAAEHLAELGVRVSVVGVGSSGSVDPGDVARALAPDTFLVSLMLANNETGVVQPVVDVAAISRAHGVRFHCDAVGALGKIGVDVGSIGCDLLSLSSHKLYAPKGCGVLYRRHGTPLEPLIHGCGQQAGMRGGTEDVPGCVAFARALERMAEGVFRAGATGELRDALWSAIRQRFPAAVRHGRGPILPNTLSVAFPGCDAHALQRELSARGIAVSVGAAGSGGAPSHVLAAMGVPAALARATLRISFGAQSTPASVDALIRALEACVVKSSQRRIEVER
jgi:cysteine desulfurase